MFRFGSAKIDVRSLFEFAPLEGPLKHKPRACQGTGLMLYLSGRIRTLDNPEVDSPPPHGDSPLTGQTRFAVCPSSLTAVGNFGVGKLRVTQQLAPKPIRLRLRLRRDATDTSVRVPLAQQVAWGAPRGGAPQKYI